MLVGLISDTHGVLPDGVGAAFAGCSHILHAGDVGSFDVLGSLSGIAPVTAVEGNTDNWVLAEALEPIVAIQFCGISIVLAHRLEDAMPYAQDHPADVLVVGHTHAPQILRRAGMLVVNPGSASRPRGGPPTVGLLELAADGPRARIIAI